ncbi:2-dehydro-3-deoxygalactonokinase [Kushneria pakistanensis]|uniref:2-dehydro-3-deoxygalactonokinase n=1 Tax=Kushneria pakistanensis TaxID=1508770 RepID=A0ABQ3FFM0_9GAMM|nr:2-dehydro-3-deoxygalactonokinase [Kushneria pakistanensis]GHC21911.1 2-dehydro-3-deoxygalactonokinase [Kushneria pakistanensis]
MNDASPCLIALDWGTSSLRAWLLDDQGRVLDSRHEPWGILHTPDNDFARAYQRVVGQWRDAHPDLPALACGMIGSRGGWHEVPYVAAPADADAIAAGLVAIDTGIDQLSLVPGVMQHDNVETGTLPNVMRGEETQLLGVMARYPALAREALLIMPGTHSKWALIERERLVEFTTHMTGELYAVLREHSILGRPALECQEDATDAASQQAFDEGLENARDAGSAGLSGQLFSVRSRVLAGELSPAASLAYLSGLLIGEEVRSATAALGDRPCPPLALIGDEALCRRYVRALSYFECRDVETINDASISGLMNIARRAGLIDPA